jgi:hypothetical protein
MRQNIVLELRLLPHLALRRLVKSLEGLGGYLGFSLMKREFFAERKTREF